VEILTVGIHDIDIARWLFDAAKTSDLPNPKKQVNRVFALGQNVRHPELSNDGDADNALAIVEFASGKILHFHCSRTTMHGHDCVAEVFGTEGRAVVNAVSWK
jgi:myo-inositol 2-dehydrogenase/D-chiro-inositol 1-dehydrogenase